MDFSTHDRAMYEYYGERAPIYDLTAGYLHEDPGVQGAFRELAAEMERVLRGRRILEIACGTGFWTQRAAEFAEHIVATDVTPKMLALARQRALPLGKVEFLEADAYELETVPGRFNAGLAMRWFSHVPKVRYGEFLEGLSRRLGSGAVVFLYDDMNRPGQLPWVSYHKPGSEDLYQKRTLPDGSEFEIIKNHFTEAQIREVFSPHARDLKIGENEHSWWATYTVA